MGTILFYEAQYADGTTYRYIGQSDDIAISKAMDRANHNGLLLTTIHQIGIDSVFGAKRYIVPRLVFDLDDQVI